MATTYSMQEISRRLNCAARLEAYLQDARRRNKYPIELVSLASSIGRDIVVGKARLVADNTWVQICVTGGGGGGRVSSAR